MSQLVGRLEKAHVAHGVQGRDRGLGGLAHPHEIGVVGDVIHDLGPPGGELVTLLLGDRAVQLDEVVACTVVLVPGDGEVRGQGGLPLLGIEDKLSDGEGVGIGVDLRAGDSLNVGLMQPEEGVL